MNGDDKQKSTRTSSRENIDLKESHLNILKNIEEGGGDPPDIDIPSVGAGLAPTYFPDVDIEDIQDKVGRPVSLLGERPQELLAREQGAIEAGAKETVKLIPEIPLTAMEYAGHIFDAGSWETAFHGANATVQRLFGADKEQVEHILDRVESDDFGNEFTRAIKGARESIDTMSGLGIDFTTYREDPSKTWDIGDPVWWAQMFSDVGRSVGAFAGIGAAAGTATRGAVGLIGRMTGASSKLRNVMTTVGQGLTATELALAEGMTTAVQVYDQTYREALEAHLEQGKSRGEAERLATKAASHGAAQTAGINTMAIPALNFLSVAPAFRSANTLKTLSSAGLAREAGETTADWLNRVSNTNLPREYTQKIFEYVRESGFESIEELANELASVEGEYRANELAGIAEPSHLGQRIAEGVFTDEGALAAFLGAVGGAGQQAAIRHIPMHQRAGDQEGIVSAATLRAEQRQARFDQMKEAVKERVEILNKWQKELKNAEAEGDTERIHTAQEKLLSESIIKSFDTGTEEHIRAMVEEINQLSEDEARDQGLETDEKSPYHYKTLSQDYLDHIDSLKESYDHYQNDYSYTPEEEAAGIPTRLFALDARIQNLARDEKRMRDEIQSIIERANDRPDGAETDEFNISEVVDAATQGRMNALKMVAKRLVDLDRTPSEFESEADLKEAIGFNDILSQFTEEVSKKAAQAIDTGRQVEVGARGHSIRDAQEFSRTLKTLLESDITRMKDLAAASPQALYDQIVEVANQSRTEEGDINSFTAPSPKAAQSILQDEVFRRSYRDSRKIYRRNLDYITTTEGRSALMERIKENDKRKAEEKIQDLRDRISDIDSIDELDDFADQLSPNIDKRVTNAVQARRNELTTQEKGKADPTRRPSQQDPLANQTAAETEQKDQSSNQRREQEGQDEPTGPQSEVGPAEPTESELGIQDRSATPEDPAEADVSNLGKRKRTSPERIIEGRINDVIRNLPEITDEDMIDDWISEGHEQLDLVAADLINNVGLDAELVDDMIQEAKDRLPLEAQSQTGSKRSSEDPDTEPGNAGYTDPSQMEQDMTVREDDLDILKIPRRGSIIAYRSREFARDDDGNVIETTNERNVDPLVETPLVGENTTLIYEVESTPTSVNDVNDITDEVIDNSVIRVYAETKGGRIEIGAIHEPASITENNTPTKISKRQSLPNNFRGNNVDLQREIVRDTRRKILNIWATRKMRSDDSPITGVITQKRGGQLSKRYVENEDGSLDYDENGQPQADFRPLTESITNLAPEGGVQLYVMRGGKPHVAQNAPFENVENTFEGQPNSRMEGTVGMILPMPNGNNLAVPLWTPTIREMGWVDRIYDLIDTPISAFQTMGTTKEEELGKLLYLSQGTIKSIFNPSNPIEGKARIKVEANGHVTIGLEGRGELYSTNPKMGSQIRDNTVRVKEILGELFLNVDLDRINRHGQIQIMEATDSGLEPQIFDSYNDFIGRYLQTDVLEVMAEDSRGQQYGVYFEQPTIFHRVEQRNEDVSMPAGRPSHHEHNPSQPDQGQPMPINEGDYVQWVDEDGNDRFPAPRRVQVASVDQSGTPYVQVEGMSNAIPMDEVVVADSNPFESIPEGLRDIAKMAYAEQLQTMEREVQDQLIFQGERIEPEEITPADIRKATAMRVREDVIGKHEDEFETYQDVDQPFALFALDLLEVAIQSDGVISGVKQDYTAEQFEWALLNGSQEEFDFEEVSDQAPEALADRLERAEEQLTGEGDTISPRALLGDAVVAEGPEVINIQIEGEQTPQTISLEEGMFATRHTDENGNELLTIRGPAAEELQQILLADGITVSRVSEGEDTSELSEREEFSIDDLSLQEQINMLYTLEGDELSEARSQIREYHGLSPYLNTKNTISALEGMLEDTDEAPEGSPINERDYTEGGLDQDMQDTFDDLWMDDENDASYFGLSTTPTDLYDYGGLSQPNFERLAEAMQNEGQLQIICKA